MTKWQWWIPFGALLAGCGDAAVVVADAGAVRDASRAACVPDRAQWTSTVRPQVERQCGACHGETPQFGSPFSLLDYDAIVAGVGGARRVDQMVTRMVAGTMPPAGTPAPTDEVARSIVQWASCGVITPPAGVGVRSSAPVFRSPTAAPAGMPSFELRADRFAITRALTERYQCYSFDVPVTAARFARRFEIALDNTQMVHHVVLLRDPAHTAPREPFECESMPDGTQFLYAWAPGQDSLQCPDGGLRMVPGDRFVLQVHYNNGSGLDGLSDSSGVRIFHDAPTGTEYGMIALGPTAFSIPARRTGSVESACTLAPGSRMLAGMPHMHGIGAALSQRVLRAGGAIDPVISLEGWRFDTQLFYDLPVTFAAGDRIVTHCDYNNTRDTVTRSGPHTDDEMCFNFAYVTPPPTARLCDEAITPRPVTTYTPGACAPPGSSSDLPLVMGSIVVGVAPESTGGVIPAGRWVLEGVRYYLSTAMSAAGAVDLTMSSIESRGQAWTGAGTVVMDLNSTLTLTLSGGIRFARPVPLSFAATFTDATSPLALTTTCPTDPAAMVPRSLNYTVTGDTLVMGSNGQSTAGITITPRFTFRRAP